MSEIPYMMENTRAEFERVRDLAWPRPPAPDLPPAEAARIARFDAAPVPDEVVVETVAPWRAELWNRLSDFLGQYGPTIDSITDDEHDDLLTAFIDGLERDVLPQVCPTLPIAALPPSPAEQAVKRVEALAEELEREAGERNRRAERTPGSAPFAADRIRLFAGARHQRLAAAQLRAALASPAPAPVCPSCGVTPEPGFRVAGCSLSSRCPLGPTDSPAPAPQGEEGQR